jgi:hypothetical protein
MVMVVMMVMVTGSGEYGTGKHQQQQNTSKQLLHNMENVARTQQRGSRAPGFGIPAPTCCGA